ncbi:MAG: cytochrome b [Luteimonas sp.]|nr:cytochrome b [Luteimonas sp.]
MTLKNTRDRWGAISQSLHWIIVVLLLAVAVIGLVMGELPRSPKYFWVYTAHKSIGITILALMLLRLGWRLYAGAPQPVPGTPVWQRRLATGTHWALYAVALAMPISGWLYDSASGLRPFRWFGLFEMPKLVRPHEWIASQAHGAHELLFLLLVALVVLHAGAAIYHHLFLRDETLRRMLPGRRKPSAP